MNSKLYNIEIQSQINHKNDIPIISIGRSSNNTVIIQFELILLLVLVVEVVEVVVTVLLLLVLL